MKTTILQAQTCVHFSFFLCISHKRWREKGTDRVVYESSTEKGTFFSAIHLHTHSTWGGAGRTHNLVSTHFHPRRLLRFEIITSESERDGDDDDERSEGKKIILQNDIALLAGGFFGAVWGVRRGQGGLPLFLTRILSGWNFRVFSGVMSESLALI